MSGKVVCTMASMTYARLVSANTRVGVDTRKKENSTVPCEVRGGDNLSVEKITGLGHPAVTNWGDMMTGMYHALSNATVHTERSKFALYQDMADEPWKYGDDILSFEEMDDELRGGVERAQVESYWQNREVLQQAELARREEMYAQEVKCLRKVLLPILKQAAKLAAKRWVEGDIRRHVLKFKTSATKIQALVRGYQARCKNHHLDCCMCLSHRICPLRTEVGYMCRDCAKVGPFEDLVENDAWNWHRAEYVDEAPKQELCCWCNTKFATEWEEDYCSYECEWKDKTA